MKIPIPNADTVFLFLVILIITILFGYVFIMSYNLYGKLPINYNPFMKSSVFVKK